MTLKQSNTAILIFTRTAVSEAKHKSFQNHIGFKQNVAIADALIQKTTQEAQSTDLPYFIIDDNHQIGYHFGERLANAVEDIFQKGFQKVIIVGNDCPKLCHHKIKFVEEQLSQHNLVIGPAKDGGTYIIGIDQSIYDREKFIQLPWLTNQLSNAFAAFSNTTLYLEEAEDIDSFSSFSTFLANTTKELQSFIFIAKTILGQIKHNQDTFQKIFYQLFTFTNASLRAPPL